MIMGYISQTATYPLSVTSTIMAANGAKIAAGRLPHIPVYDSWLACLKDLHKMVNFSVELVILCRAKYCRGVFLSMYVMSLVLP